MKNNNKNKKYPKPANEYKRIQKLNETNIKKYLSNIDYYLSDLDNFNSRQMAPQDILMFKKLYEEYI